MKATDSNHFGKNYLKILVTCPLFQGLTEIELLAYLQQARITVHNYSKNEFIAFSGEPMSGIGIILEGKVLIMRENVAGQRAFMTEMGASNMFGEALLFSKSPLWPATIKALTRTKLFFLPFNTFMQTLPDCPDCQKKIFTNLLMDLSEKALLLTKKVHYLTLKGMREKIFAYLTTLYKEQQKDQLLLPHTRQEIADLLNVCRTSLSRELHKLHREGIITLSGKHVLLHNIPLITEYAF